MKLVRRIIASLIAAVIMVGFIPAMSAYAGTINRVNISVTHTTQVGDIMEPVITVSASNYTIEDIDWSKDLSKWKPGQYVTCSVTLSCGDEDEFAFGKDMKYYVTTNKDGDYSATQCDHYNGRWKDNNTYVVSFRYYPIVQMDCPSRAGWSDNNRTRANWSRVPGAPNYQVELYEQSGDRIRTAETTDTTYDFSSYMNEGKQYYYTVRSIGKTSDEKKYYITSEWKESDDTVVEYQTAESDTGSDSGTQTVTEGSWLEKNGQWYYTNTDGSLKTGWILDRYGNWYYLGSDGVMKIGWYETEAGKWYYSYPNGVMARDTSIEGYKLNADGLWIQ